MTIADALTETKFSLKVSLSAIAFRIILLPAVILAIAYILPVDTDIKRILLMQSAMPAALFPIVLAKHYGGIPSLVAEVIITTSLVSFITMPLIVTFGLIFYHSKSRKLKHLPITSTRGNRGCC